MLCVYAVSIPSVKHTNISKRNLFNLNRKGKLTPTKKKFFFSFFADKEGKVLWLLSQNLSEQKLFQLTKRKLSLVPFLCRSWGFHNPSLSHSFIQRNSFFPRLPFLTATEFGFNLYSLYYWLCCFTGEMGQLIIMFWLIWG